MKALFTHGKKLKKLAGFVFILYARVPVRVRVRVCMRACMIASVCARTCLNSCLKLSVTNFESHKTHKS